MNWKRMTLYSAGLTVLLFAGCATIGEGIKEVGDFVASVDPSTVEGATKTAGQVVSYFWPAVGGAITTAGSALGWLTERSKKKKYFKAAEGYADALETVKKDLQNGGTFDSYDQLKKVIDQTQSASREGKEVYHELKGIWNQK